MASAAAFREEICVFGDSITQHGSTAQHGWVAQLQELYRRRADVLNRGFSGYNTRNAAHMSRYIFGAGRTYWLSTVFFGANDQADAALKPDQHVGPEEYAANLAAVVQAARRVSRVVVVIAPPPVDHGRWGDRTLERAAQYGALARAVVERLQREEGAVEGSAACAAPPQPVGNGVLQPPYPATPASSPLGTVLFLDTLATFLGAPPPPPFGPPFSNPPGSIISTPPAWGPYDPAAGDPSWFPYLSDGLHLSPAGNTLLFNALTALLASGAPGVLPAAMTIDFPVFRDIPAGEVEKAFSEGGLGALHSLPRELP